ncbi:MAG: sigma-70 family RNA polymerase sigma factor [Elusimicrobia bacterium]|nr:sigma-70 family RNA polymerase sigma factor [Elusimicrobiota bacterium]
MPVPDRTVLDAQRGDLEAMGQIYSAYIDLVWNISLKMTLNRTHAEEAASEVFLRIFRKISKFKFRSSFKTWVYRLTVNTVINYIEKEKRRKTWYIDEERLEREYGVPAAQEDPAEKDMCGKLLAGLRQRERMLLILREIEGMSYCDIAEAAGMSIGAVKTGIYRARESLRRAYKSMEA